MQRVEFSYTFKGRTYRCVGERADRPWGHALNIHRYDSAAALVDSTSWGCHPEAEDFDALQTLTTEELAQLVRRGMCRDAFEATMQSANANGMRIYFQISTKWRASHKGQQRSDMLARSILLGLLAVGPVHAQAQQAAPSPPPMECKTGPVSRTFGGTEWIVYSCDDRSSMVVVSAQGNPASPSYFLLKLNAEGYKIEGESNGDKKASNAAVDDLSKLGLAGFAALLAATKSGPKSQ